MPKITTERAIVAPPVSKFIIEFSVGEAKDLLGAYGPAATGVSLGTRHVLKPILEIINRELYEGAK